MKGMVLATVGLLLAHSAVSAPVGCPDLLAMGHAAAERINLIHTAYDAQRQRLGTTANWLKARNEAARAARDLEYASAKLKLVVAAAQTEGCANIDALVEAESQGEESVQAVRAEVADIDQPEATGSIGKR